VKAAIFGSTGGTGRQLVEQALEQGHHVTAHARSPEKLGGLSHENLEVRRGDVLDRADVMLGQLTDDTYVRRAPGVSY
jgi:uncharacterized protein YbjT (DUF2867 family)